MLRYVHGLLLVSLSVSCINNIRVVIGPCVLCGSCGHVGCTRTVFCSSSWVWTRCGRDARACLAAPRALPAAESSGIGYLSDIRLLVVFNHQSMRCRWTIRITTMHTDWRRVFSWFNFTFWILHADALSRGARATTRRNQTPLLSSLVPLRRVCVWAGPGAPRAARRGRPRQALGTSAVVCRDGTGCGVAPPAAWAGPGPGTWDLHAEACMVVA